MTGILPNQADIDGYGIYEPGKIYLEQQREGKQPLRILLLMVKEDVKS